MKWPLPEHWKAETMLKDMPADELLTLEMDGRPAFHTTPRLLMEINRISGTLFIDQIEWAFSNAPMPKPVPLPIYSRA